MDGNLGILVILGRADIELSAGRRNTDVKPQPSECFTGYKGGKYLEVHKGRGDQYL